MTIGPEHRRVVNHFLNRGYQDKHFNLFLRLCLAPLFMDGLTGSDVIDRLNARDRTETSPLKSLDRRVRKYFAKHPDDKDDWETEILEQMIPRVVPDLWRLHLADDPKKYNVIEIIEVVDTHPPSQEKLEAYFWWEDANEQWSVSLKQALVGPPTTLIDINAQAHHAAFKKMFENTRSKELKI